MSENMGLSGDARKKNRININTSNVYKDHQGNFKVLKANQKAHQILVTAQV